MGNRPGFSSPFLAVVALTLLVLVLPTPAGLTAEGKRAFAAFEALSETLVSLVDFATYTVMRGQVEVSTIAAASLGVMLASPVAASTVKRAKGNMFRALIGVLASIVGRTPC
ncbi:hypothetical protein KAW53_05630 [Candidatus Bathyarchaeota archaeon]|nr:hypothetical protein [Candidatus Bathyarchaeota archaeon]MCK4437868.1 hypothetical protein [Candidatus Bathyarchaeota archaeon]